MASYLRVCNDDHVMFFITSSDRSHHYSCSVDDVVCAVLSLVAVEVVDEGQGAIDNSCDDEGFGVESR